MVVSFENLLWPNTFRNFRSSCFFILPRFVLICLVVMSSRSCFLTRCVFVSSPSMDLLSLSLTTYLSVKQVHPLYPIYGSFLLLLRTGSLGAIGLSKSLWRDPMWTRNSRWSVLLWIGSLMTSPWTVWTDRRPRNPSWRFLKSEIVASLLESFRSTRISLDSGVYSSSTSFMKGNIREKLRLLPFLEVFDCWVGFWFIVTVPHREFPIV